MIAYPHPTTDADAFVAGMEAAHEGAADNWQQESKYLAAVIRDLRDAVLADDSGASLETRMKVLRLVRRVGPLPRKQHYEVLNEEMEWDPQS